MRYRILGRERRNKIREISRECYILCEITGDGPEKAKKMAEMRVRAEFNSIITMILVGLAVRLIVELIKYWIEQKFSRPSEGYQPGEPGYTP